jgi:hypothetical protein
VYDDDVDDDDDYDDYDGDDQLILGMQSGIDDMRFGIENVPNMANLQN